jgi:hypothetical protein
MDIKNARNLKVINYKSLSLNQEQTEALKRLYSTVSQESTSLSVTPIGKNFIKRNQVTKTDDNTSALKPLQGELVYFEKVFKILKEYYGQSKDFPKIIAELIKTGTVGYDKFDEDEFLMIDDLRNYVKMGREKTNGSNARRESNLNKYFKQFSNLSLSKDIVRLTIYVIRRMINPDQDFVELDEYNVNDAGSAFSNYKTNVGWPYFIRDDRKLSNGEPVDKASLKLAKQLNLEEVSDIPSVLFGRDQRSGCVFTSTLAKPDEFKESKARVI